MPMDMCPAPISGLDTPPFYALAVEVRVQVRSRPFGVHPWPEETGVHQREDELAPNPDGPTDVPYNRCSTATWRRGLTGRDSPCRQPRWCSQAPCDGLVQYD